MIWCTFTWEIAMLKIVAAGVTALFVTASPLAYAQAPAERAMERLSAADWAKVTDERIDLVKSALQLTPDQQKYWPAVEDAIRARAKNRQARLAQIEETMGKRSDETLVEKLKNRDPIAFLNRRANALAQRSTDLKNLATAWEPLYKTLTPEQKKRMAALTLFVLRDLREDVEHRRLQAEEDED
jgi:hypothetical protein